jgi:hypothetical protein
MRPACLSSEHDQAPGTRKGRSEWSLNGIALRSSSWGPSVDDVPFERLQ